MLQEHGSRRPSVFELLVKVHRLRGTKSRFQYKIPIPQPLSSRHQTQFKSSPSPNHVENLVSSPAVHPTPREPDPIPSTSLPPKTQSIYARDNTIDDQLSMRRGRPTSSKGYVSTSKPETLQISSASPAASSGKVKQWTDGSFIPEDDQVWKSAIANTATLRKDEIDDVWKVGRADMSNTSGKKGKQQGFGDDFGEKLWETFEDKANLPTQIKASPHTNSMARASVMHTRTHARPSTTKGKDAFEGLGLGLSSDRPAPTLGEARKLRTGLAILSTRPNGSDSNAGVSSSRLTPPRQLYVSQSPSQSQFLSSAPRPSSSASGMSWRTSPQPSARPSSSVQPESLPAETRFPSLEDLDATFASSSERASRNSTPHTQQVSDVTPALPPRNNRHGHSAPRTSGLLMKPPVQHRGWHGQGDMGLEQVTNVAVREFRPDINDHRGEGRADAPSRVESKAVSSSQPPGSSNLVPRHSFTRKHRSSTIIKYTSPNVTGDVGPTSPPSSLPVQGLTSSYPRLPTKSKDWLTGEDDLQETSSIPAPPIETVVFRQSPSKRASVIQKAIVPIQDAIVPQHDHTPSLQHTPSSLPVSAPPDISPTISKFTRTFPSIETTDHVQRDKLSVTTQDRTPVAARTARKPMEPESSSSADEGPEDATGSRRMAAKVPVSTGKPKRKGRQSSVHDLVDLWGGGIGHKDIERETHTPRLTSSKLETSIDGYKTQTVVSPLASAKSNPNPRISPLRPMLTPTGIDPRLQQSPSGDPPSGATASRSRPQSMIIFPSKSTDTYSGLSSGHSLDPASLAPPSTPSQKSGIRRTSISGIVQRYEGIGKGKSMGLSGPPSPDVSRPALKVGSLLTENGWHFKGQAQKGQVVLLPPLSSDASYRSSNPTEDTRISPNSSRISPRTPSPLSQSVTDPSPEGVVHRAPKLSFNRETSKPTFTPNSKLVDDSLSRLGDERSSSPERPYQGVGKLIDQWQRKTAEASATRTTVGRGRGSFVGKRGVVHGISGRSQ